MEYELHNYVVNSVDSKDSLFQKIMHERTKAYELSVKHQIPKTKQYKIKAQTVAFLQNQGLDAVQFQQVDGLHIQHQLTKELIKVLDDIADYAVHHHELYQIDLTKYCAHLASVTQKANIQGALQQAIHGTNCCHGILHYLKGMASGVVQAYDQFQTALDYFDVVVDTYGNLILQHVAQGAIIAHGLEGIITAGIIAAPAATVAATGAMIGATAYVMAPLCAQAIINLKDFGGACIVGNWDKIVTDLDNFKNWISSKETVARMAELAGGAAMPTPNLNYAVDQVLSLRPVITRVQNASGKMTESLYLMSKNQIQKVYQQGVELLQLPEFINFNMKCEKNWGSYFFNILPKGHPALAVAFADSLEVGAMNNIEQVLITSLFNQAEGSEFGNIINASVSSVGSEISKTVEECAKAFVTEQVHSIDQLHEILQQEITQALKQQIIKTDLTVPITAAKYFELKELSLQIRQLQDLARYTDNFTNIENLILEDICYLNRIYELQTYRAQIKQFLDTYKPYFVYDGQKYFIEDIASYHIHAGEYTVKGKPTGGHSNYDGRKLDYFNPEVIKNGPIGAKDVVFHNSRKSNLIKASSIYPEDWSEFVCDLNAIEVMTSGNAIIKINDDLKSFNIIGYTSNGLEIRIIYDILAKRITTHHLLL